MNANLPKSKSKNSKKKFNRKLKFDITTKYCPRYCISGRCQFLAQCPYVHDDDKVAICKKFLNGKKCTAVKCPLSHNLTPDKMPDCLFFLKGYCKVENCNYRHVKVNRNSEFCNDFSRGYCPKGLQCEKSHTFLCKAFKATGDCPKGARCSYEHKLTPKKIKKLQKLKESSKYKKVINSKSSASNTSLDCLSPTTSKLNHQRSIVNVLLAKRLKTSASSKDLQQSNCYSNSSLPILESLPEFVSVSPDGGANSSGQQISEQTICNNKVQSAAIDTKSLSSVSNALKKKYFVIDIDEEKLSDYLNVDSPESSDHICRPQLKIVPDCLLHD